MNEQVYRVVISCNLGLHSKKLCFCNTPSEDGGEKRTVFEHNLGMGTRKSSLTPSDREPATFWITSPLTTLTNNAAAGSVSKSGVGIWYLFPDEPIALCKGLGIFEKKEAKNTPIPRYVHIGTQVAPSEV